MITHLRKKKGRGKVNRSLPIIHVFDAIFYTLAEFNVRILYVEDDAMNRRVVKDMLSVIGAQMEEAENGILGLEKVESQSGYDIILMDLRMPGMDGLTAIEKIRARSDSKAKLPIIVITADTSTGLYDDCIGVGADDVLMKPVAMDALMDSMGRVIAGGDGDEVMLG